jgi:hypothetical protein
VQGATTVANISMDRADDVTVPGVTKDTLVHNKSNPDFKLNPNAKEFTPKQQSALTKLFNDSLGIGVNKVDPKYVQNRGYPKQMDKSMPLTNDRGTATYRAARRVPNERFLMQRQKQYTAKKVAKASKGKGNNNKHWSKDQEVWTQVTKRLRVRHNKLKGYRYKGSKQYRDPVPKVKVASRMEGPRQVFNINAANVYINNKPEPTKDMLSNNYYNVLSVDDSDDIGPMYQPKYNNLPSYNNNKGQSKARKNRGQPKARQAPINIGVRIRKGGHKSPRS